MAPGKVAKLQQWLQQPEVHLLYAVLEAQALSKVSEILSSTSDEALRDNRDQYQEIHRMIDLMETISKGVDDKDEPYHYHEPPYAQQTQDPIAEPPGPEATAIARTTFRPGNRGRAKIPRPPRAAKG